MFLRVNTIISVKWVMLSEIMQEVSQGVRQRFPRGYASMCSNVTLYGPRRRNIKFTEKVFQVKILCIPKLFVCYNDFTSLQWLVHLVPMPSSPPQNLALLSLVPNV